MNQEAHRGVYATCKLPHSERGELGRDKWFLLGSLNVTFHYPTAYWLNSVKSEYILY